MGSIFGVVGTVSSIILIALVVTGIIAFRRGRLTFPTVVHTYTAFLLALCIVLGLAGGALLVKSITSTAITRDFSYQTADFPGSFQPGQAAAERADTQAGDELTAGITLLVIGAGLGFAHAFGNVIATRRDVATATAVERGFVVSMLIVGTVVGLTSGAILLNDLLRRYVITTAAPTAYNKPHPGGALGYAVMFIPLWVYFARRVWRTMASHEGVSAAGGEVAVRNEERPAIAGGAGPTPSTAA